MAWTYNAADLEESLNAVRLMIGDTNSDDQQLQDEEIQLFIDASDTNERAALQCLRVLATKYARYVDKWVGDLKILASQRYRAYVEQIQQLETGSGGGSIAAPVAGGIRISDKCSQEQNTDLVQPYFRRDMHDFQGNLRRGRRWGRE